MPHPPTMSLSKPCPDCGGRLVRKTIQPDKPFGMAACLTCPFTKPIRDFVRDIQNAKIVWAHEKVRLSKENNGRVRQPQN